MTATQTETNEALILSGSGYELSVAPEIIEQKANLIKHAAMIVEVNDPVSSDAAGNQIKKLAAMRNLVEKSRTTVKAPVLAVGKRIDTLAADFQAEISAEENRLKKLQGDYAMLVVQERQRVLAEMEKARIAEAKRIADEDAAAAKIESDRIAAEKAQWDADTPEQESTAAKAVEAAKAAELKRLEAAAQAQVAVATPAFIPEAPKGVKMIPDYELTDILALLNHNAGLVTLTDRRKEILEAIARGMIGDVPPQIPGIRVFMRPQVR